MTFSFTQDQVDELFDLLNQAHLDSVGSPSPVHKPDCHDPDGRWLAWRHAREDRRSGGNSRLPGHGDYFAAVMFAEPGFESGLHQRTQPKGEKFKRMLTGK